MGNDGSPLRPEHLGIVTEPIESEPTEAPTVLEEIASQEPMEFSLPDRKITPRDAAEIAAVHDQLESYPVPIASTAASRVSIDRINEGFQTEDKQAERDAKTTARKLQVAKSRSLLNKIGLGAAAAGIFVASLLGINREGTTGTSGLENGRSDVASGVVPPGEANAAIEANLYENNAVSGLDGVSVDSPDSLIDASKDAQENANSDHGSDNLDPKGD